MARQGGAGTCVASASAMLPSRRRSRCAPDATNYFFGFPGQEEELELTFNHDRRSYEIGTAYGHIAIGVDDLDETLARLKTQGIEPERAPYRVREGGSRLTFVRDPDSYRVELIEQSGK
jgi:lactoylglutathione lyase